MLVVRLVKLQAIFKFVTWKLSKYEELAFEIDVEKLEAKKQHLTATALEVLS